MPHANLLDRNIEVVLDSYSQSREGERRRVIVRDVTNWNRPRILFNRVVTATKQADGTFVYHLDPSVAMKTGRQISVQWSKADADD